MTEEYCEEKEYCEECECILNEHDFKKICIHCHNRKVKEKGEEHGNKESYHSKSSCL